MKIPLNLIYSVDYNGLGKKQSVFTFNENCEFRDIRTFQDGS